MQDLPLDVRAPFKLGDRVVRPDLNEITGDNGVERVGPRAMDVLCTLAGRPDAVVTKQELLDSVWTDLYVGDEVLSTAIWELRKAFGDDARAPRFIQTVPRRGYRLLIMPEAVGGSSAGAAAAGDLPATVESVSRHANRTGVMLLGVLFAAAAVIATVFAFRMLPREKPRHIRGLAVLPIEALGGGPRDQALADGVTDTLITELAGIDGLRVVSRTTIQTYRGGKLTIPEIARRLGVDVLVEGTLAREEGRIVLNAQLIDAVSEDHLWAETYERRFEHLLDLQVEIARSIGAAIADRLEPPSTVVSTPTLPAEVTGDLLRWRFATGGEIWSDPVSVHDSVVFGSRDGYLYSVGLADGAERWRVEIGDEVVGRPLVLDGALFAAAHVGRIVALNAETGVEHWRFRLATTTICGLVAGAGMVVAADEAEQVVALDASSGRQLWTWRGGTGVVGVAVGGKQVLVSRFDGAVTALDAVDGCERWTTPVGEWLHWPVTVDGDRLLVPSPSGAVVALAVGDGSEVWRAAVEFPSQPVVWRDRVLVGGDGEAVVALDRSSGDELWRFVTRGFIHCPTVSGDLVLAGAQDNSVYALDAWSGELRWHADMRTWVTTTPLAADGLVVFGSLDGAVYALAEPPRSQLILAIPQEEGFRARPEVAGDRGRTYDLVVDAPGRGRPRIRWRVAADAAISIAPRFAGGVLLVASAQSLAALDVVDGAEQWRVSLGAAAGTVPLVVGDLVVVGARDGKVTAFGLGDGAERWLVTTGGDVISTPALAGSTLLFGSRDGFFYAVDTENGDELWRRQLDTIHGSPTVADGVVFVPSRNDTLWALSVADGKVLWSAPTTDWAVADPVVWQDRVLLGACDGTFEAFDRSSGELLWKFATGGDIWYRPAVVDGRVYFGSGDHHVYAVDAVSGRELWRRRTGNRAWSSIAAWRDLVFAGSHDRQLWAIDAGDGEPMWRLRTSGIMGSPSVAGDLLAVGGGDGYVYLLELDP